MGAGGGGSLYDVISCLAAWSHIPSRGSVSLVPCSFWGSLSSGDPPLNQKSGWYASYWNVFLFNYFMLRSLIYFIIIELIILIRFYCLRYKTSWNVQHVTPCSFCFFVQNVCHGCSPMPIPNTQKGYRVSNRIPFANCANTSWSIISIFEH